MSVEHWMTTGLLGANASFQRAAREYAEEYAAMVVAALAQSGPSGAPAEPHPFVIPVELPDGRIAKMRQCDLRDDDRVAFIDSQTLPPAEPKRIAADAPAEPPMAPKLIGWRTSDYLMETADPKQAKNWQGHYSMLPIFEGDLHTKLSATPQPSTAGAGTSPNDIERLSWLDANESRIGWAQGYLGSTGGWVWRAKISRYSTDAASLRDAIDAAMADDAAPHPATESKA